MPRVRVTVPDELFQAAGDRAQELDKSISDLFTDAIERYIEITKNATPGSLRSRPRVIGASHVIGVEVPETVFQTADKLAKRLGKRREVLYCEALAMQVSRSPSAPSAIDKGHDLPTGAWRPDDAE